MNLRELDEFARAIRANGSQIGGILVGRAPVEASHGPIAGAIDGTCGRA
jgi:hypothetical protein